MTTQFEEVPSEFLTHQVTEPTGNTAPIQEKIGGIEEVPAEMMGTVEVSSPPAGTDYSAMGAVGGAGVGKVVSQGTALKDVSVAAMKHALASNNPQVREAAKTVTNFLPGTERWKNSAKEISEASKQIVQDTNIRKKAPQFTRQEWKMGGKELSPMAEKLAAISPAAKVIGKYAMRYANPIIGGALAGAQGMNAAEDFSKGDYLGGAINTIGAGAGAAAMYPPFAPVAIPISLATEGINYLRHRADGGIVQNYAKGGEVEDIGPYIGYPQIRNKPRDPNFVQQSGPFLGSLDAILGAKRDDVSRLTPEGQAYHEAYQKFEPAGIVANVMPFMGGTLKKAGSHLVRSVAPKALTLAEMEANRAAFLAPSAVKERMYHGTTQDINAFDPSRKLNTVGDFNRGMTFVSPNPKLANYYAGKGEGANVMPVHVQVRNPFDYQNPEQVQALANKIVQSGGYHPTVASEKAKQYATDLSRGNWGNLEQSNVMKAAQDLGHDAMYMQEHGVKNLGIFDPNRIKSAVGNRGTYDITNPMINMATGGSVPHFQAGGIASLAKMPLTKILRMSEALAPHEGKILNITQSDRMRSTMGDLGGPGFSKFQREHPDYAQAQAAWGVGNQPTASRIVNVNKKYPEGQAIWSPMIGSETQHHSNQHVYDMLSDEFNRQASMGNLPPELRARINAKLASTVNKEGKNLFAQNIDVANPEALKEAGQTFEKRAAMANLLAGNTVGGTKGRIIDYPGIMQEMTDPMTVGAPTHSVGTRLFTLNNQVENRPDLHSAFPYILKGEDQGVAFAPVPKELAIQDWINNFKDFKGREPGYMDLTRNTPSQQITEQYLRSLQDAGHKKGGLVGLKKKKK